MAKIRMWSRAGKQRAYVEGDDQRRLGHWNPDADAPERIVPNPDSKTPGDDTEQMRRILADNLGLSMSRTRIANHPWTDLATNAPGSSIAHLAASDVSYGVGVAGEQRTAGVLSPLANIGWRVLHSVPLGEAKDIDHLVIGPVGVLAINTKSTSYPVSVTEGTVSVDGYRKAWVDSITRDAVLASKALSAACREQVPVEPVVAVWSPRLDGGDHRVVAGDRLRQTLGDLPMVFDRTWVEGIFALARRSDTWANVTAL